MKTKAVLILLAILASTLACQFLMPTGSSTLISDCDSIVSAVAHLRPVDIPEHLLSTGEKQGNEFDVNRYFSALPHLSMHAGYALDYVYQNDDLGGYPILFARPDDLAPYTSIADVPQSFQSSEFRDYLNVVDVERGYFEYVVMDIMANQFYLSWHANYNDTQIVCSREEVDSIVAQVNSGDFGNPVGPVAQFRARLMRNIEPTVTLAGDVAKVQVITFSKWGGFYRLTYTISREFPHTIVDIQENNLVPYDCGVTF